MKLEVPATLLETHQLLGVAWPQADEDQMFSEARVWQTGGAALLDLAVDADVTTQDLVHNNDSEVVDRFQEVWQQEHAAIRILAESARTIGILLDDGGMAVHATKHTLLKILLETTRRIVVARQMAPVTVGAHPALIEEAIHAGRTAAMKALDDLRSTMETVLNDHLANTIEDYFEQLRAPRGKPG